MKEKEEKTKGISDNEVYIIGSGIGDGGGGGSSWNRRLVLLAAISAALLAVVAGLWLYYGRVQGNVATSAANDSLSAKKDSQAIKPVLVSSNDFVYEMVEELPSYPGGMGELFGFLAGNIKYPEDAIAQGQEGRVMVSFVIKADGSISDVKVASGVCESLDREAVRVVKTMPKWTPGKQNGKAVNVRFSIPITFRLN